MIDFYMQLLTNKHTLILKKLTRLIYNEGNILKNITEQRKVCKK